MALQAVVDDDDSDLEIDASLSPLEDELSREPHELPPRQTNHPRLPAFFDSIRPHPQDKSTSWHASLMSQFRKLRSAKEKKYWIKMAFPNDPTANQLLAELDQVQDLTVSARPSKRDQRTAKRKGKPYLNHKDLDKDAEHVKSEKYQAGRQFLNRLCEADIQMYLATRNIRHCNGEDLPRMSVQDMIEEIVENHSTAEVAAEKLRFDIQPELQVLEGSFSAVDVDGIPVLFVMNDYITTHQVESHTKKLEAMAEHVKLKKKLADCNKRGSHYVYKRGRLTGAVHCAIAWVGLGKKKTDLAPSAGNIGGTETTVTKTARAFQAIQKYQAGTRELSTLINYALFRLAPESYRSHVEMKAKLTEQLDCARALSVNNPVVLVGCAFIFSRSTPLHFDHKEPPEGWAILVVLGDCTTGMLAIPRLGIKFRYLPGTVVLLRGRLLDHEVVEWDGEGMRICLAYFNHETEWNFSGVRPAL
ncbi:hypothetical protein BDV93DRAFT_519987 [Ceratobasidium sp. AG-I]|nr:hypothetical protein BDV93DRAFT_519987 [Ceratobasidium sp. AG-I]